jgi:hypothetical protein
MDLLHDEGAMYIRCSHPVSADVRYLLFRITDRSQEKKLQSDTDIFGYINEFWKELPIQKQGDIFNKMFEIKAVIEDTFDINYLIQGLITPVAELIGLHDFEALRRKISLDPYVHIPEKCTAEYDSSDEKPGSRDQTYLREDYIKLVASLVLFKVMVPIWTEFMHHTASQIGDYKEYFAYMLLKDSYVPNLDSIAKLERYINASIGKGGDNSLNVMINGTGTEDYPAKLLASLVVSKFAMAPVNPVGAESNVITAMYYYVKQHQNGSAPTKYADMVKPKTTSDSSGSDENKASNMEAYKISQSISIGDKTMFNVYMSDILRVASKLDSKMDMRLLDEFYQQALGLVNARISTIQVTLVQFVLKRVISPRGVVLLKKKELLNAIAVAQTWLWQNNYHSLAGIVGGVAMLDDQVTFVGGNSSRVRLPIETVAEIEKLFPISVIPQGSSIKSKQINPIIKAIDKFNEELSANDWTLRMSPEKIKLVTGYEGMTRLSCPNDIKVIIANLIIQLAPL